MRLEVPPLRARKEDLPTLAEAFMNDMGRLPTDLSPKALEALLRSSIEGFAERPFRAYRHLRAMTRDLTGDDA